MVVVVAGSEAAILPGILLKVIIIKCGCQEPSRIREKSNQVLSIIVYYGVNRQTIKMHDNGRNLVLPVWGLLSDWHGFG